MICSFCAFNVVVWFVCALVCDSVWCVCVRLCAVVCVVCAVCFLRVSMCVCVCLGCLVCWCRGCFWLRLRVLFNVFVCDVCGK